MDDCAQESCHSLYYGGWEDCYITDYMALLTSFSSTEPYKESLSCAVIMVAGSLASWCCFGWMNPDLSCVRKGMSRLKHQRSNIKPNGNILYSTVKIKTHPVCQN